MEWTWTESADINDLREKLIVFAQHRGYDVRKIGKDILEMSRSSSIRQLTGLTSGARLILKAAPGRTVVQVEGTGKEFAMKGVGLVGIAIPLLLPIAATAARGAYVQNKLMDDLKKEIDDYFDSLA